MRQFRENIRIAMRCDACEEDAMFTLRPNLGMTIAELYDRGWKITTYKDDDEEFICCPDCAEEIPQISIN